MSKLLKVAKEMVDLLDKVRLQQDGVKGTTYISPKKMDEFRAAIVEGEQRELKQGDK